MSGEYDFSPDEIAAARAANAMDDVTSGFTSLRVALLAVARAEAARLRTLKATRTARIAAARAYLRGDRVPPHPPRDGNT